MQEVPMKDKKSELAMVIARGGSIIAWAKKNEVAERTAFYWAKEPKVLEEVEEWRRQSFDQALGRINSRARKAADGVFNLAAFGESESVRLRAWRAILADQMAIARFSTLDRRMLELEEVAKAQQKGGVHPGYNSRPGEYSTAAPG
jgi:hypothetical protein